MSLCSTCGGEATALVSPTCGAPGGWWPLATDHAGTRSPSTVTAAAARGPRAWRGRGVWEKSVVTRTPRLSHVQSCPFIPKPIRFIFGCKKFSELIRRVCLGARIPPHPLRRVRGSNTVMLVKGERGADGSGSALSREMLC